MWGGDGDCAYTSIATGLADPSKEKASPKDLRPGGSVQAQLRCWAAKEIRKHPERYEAALPTPEAFALEVAKNGVWADSVSMMALARAANIELRIWARRENLPWQLYELRGSQKPTGVVWLVLENYHYRLLRLKTKKQPPQTLRKEAIVLSDGPIKQEGKWQRFAPSSQAQEAKTNPALKRPAEAAEEPDNKRPAAKAEKKDTLTGAGYTKILEGGGGSRCGSVRSQAVSTARSSVSSWGLVRQRPQSGALR